MHAAVLAGKNSMFRLLCVCACMRVYVYVCVCVHAPSGPRLHSKGIQEVTGAGMGVGMGPEHGRHRCEKEAAPKA
eukprot:195334-Pelagomonas_calceolata.AAC.3